MILKHILFKNFILKTLKNNYKLINIILFTKQLTVLYIICYTQASLNTQFLFINTLSFLNNNLKIIKFFTNNPYVNSTNIGNFITNWKILQQQLLLLKWIIYLINLINRNKIKLPFNNIIKIFKKFIKLKRSYWTIVNLKNPQFIFILSHTVGHNLLKNYAKMNTQLFFILNSSFLLSHFDQSVVVAPNILCFRLILELIVTANIQRNYSIKKI